jgi:hypothetical protein
MNCKQFLKSPPFTLPHRAVHWNWSRIQFNIDFGTCRTVTVSTEMRDPLGRSHIALSTEIEVESSSISILGPEILWITFASFYSGTLIQNWSKDKRSTNWKNSPPWTLSHRAVHWNRSRIHFNIDCGTCISVKIFTSFQSGPLIYSEKVFQATATWLLRLKFAKWPLIISNWKASKN